jgi:hypothetical protein
MVEFPEQLWLEFDRRERSAAWPNDGEYSYDAARWNAFLNRLCLDLVVPWLEEESGLAAKVWPSEADLPVIWEVVNGMAVALDKTRFVLIPSEALDIAEFCVPQEWVDIPSWAGDYYLAVQVNPDGGWLRVWGYATHEMLKSKGIYDELERCYCLRREDAIENLNVMWVAVEVGADERMPVKPLPVLHAMPAENLLAQLSRPSPYSPRLDVGFEQWGALLDSASWRQQLYKRRMLAVAGDVAPANPGVVKLSNWLRNNFVGTVGAGWQAIEAFLTPEQQQLAFRFRGKDSGQEGAKLAKLTDLGLQLGGKAIVLLVAVAPDAGEKVSVRVQAHPAAGEKHLPPLLKLALLSDSGETLQVVQSRSLDNYIQLNRFKGVPGTSFTIEVALGAASVVEEFEI